MTDEFSPLPFLPNDDDSQETRAVDSTRRLDQRTPPRGIPPVVNRPNIAPPPPPMPRQVPPQIPPPPPRQTQTGQVPKVPPKTLPPAPKKRGKARNRRQSGLYLPLWSLGLMLVVVFIIAGGIILVVMGLGGRNTAQIPLAPPPVMVINTLVPTNTPANQPLIPATPTIPAIFEPVVGGGQPNIVFSLAGPTLPVVEISPTPQPLGVGATVLVTGVGATQLNVRDSAGVIGTNIMFRANDGEPFVIIGGPELVDNLTWWRIQNPNDSTQSGWAAGQYLQVTP